MKISLITVCFNSEKTIEHTIMSVLAQDYGNIEYIIIDGASSDATCHIIEKYKDNIAYFISEPDHGIYDAMNKGIKIATGDVIGIINADDIYASTNIISTVASAFCDHNVDTVYGDLCYVKANDVDIIDRKWIAGQYHDNSFLWGWMPPHPTFFVRKHLYITHGLFVTTLKTAADYEMTLRLLHIKKVSTFYINRILVLMRNGGVSNQNFLKRLSANKQDRVAWKLNGKRPYFFTLFLKPLRKIRQFF